MQDFPTKIELLAGVESFLTEEAIVELDGPAKFHARVAANVVRMVMRELENEEDDLRDEHAELAELLGRSGARPERFDSLRHEVLALEGELAQKIQGGAAEESDFRARAIAHLRAEAVRKLAVTNPKMNQLVRRELGQET